MDKILLLINKYWWYKLNDKLYLIELYLDKFLNILNIGINKLK
jgi:hypothetical protein